MIWLALPALAAAAYYLLVLVAAARWSRQPAARAASERPPISILKPLHGRDPGLYEALRSHASQDYPEFEILFGTTDPDDPALADAARLRAEFPALAIGITVVSTDAPNAKAGVLAKLARQARHPVLLVNDSDITVDPGYLDAVTEPLADSRVGLVTCLYRAKASSPASRMEALGIATEFAPSVLVARLLGNAEFALGSTLAFRAKVLAEVGGWEAIADYIADDYQLGRRISERGYRIHFAPMVVATDLGAGSWGEVWRHQLRWSRTIRVSRPGGYCGYGVTHATFWALVAFAGGQWWAGGLALAVRIAAGVVVGAGTLGDRNVARDFWLIPVRDLFGFAVWVAGAFGSRVAWRDRVLELRADGRIGP